MGAIAGVLGLGHVLWPPVVADAQGDERADVAHRGADDDEVLGRDGHIRGSEPGSVQ